jgi:hypothetical protein
MTTVVAIIAPGAMGAGVGKRLTSHGVGVLTTLAGRSEATVARARDAGMVAASEEEIAAADFILSILPPGEALALAQQLAPSLKAGLCRLQRHQSGDGRACRQGDCADRLPVRRRRHHRRAAPSHPSPASGGG